jgi:hypothetical protein
MSASSPLIKLQYAHQPNIKIDHNPAKIKQRIKRRKMTAQHSKSQIKRQN